jgi:hypothetical protein
MKKISRISASSQCDVSRSNSAGRLKQVMRGKGWEVMCNKNLQDVYPPLSAPPTAYQSGVMRFYAALNQGNSYNQRFA